MDIHNNASLTPLGRKRMVKMVLNGSSAIELKVRPACKVVAWGLTNCIGRRRSSLSPSVSRSCAASG